MSVDHGRLLRNTILWALNEELPVVVNGAGFVDVTVWRQENSMTVHLVNFTNPMMMKGPFRELIPVDLKVRLNIPAGQIASGVRLLVRDTIPEAEITKNAIIISVPAISDHEIIAVDFA